MIHHFCAISKRYFFTVAPPVNCSNISSYLSTYCCNPAAKVRNNTNIREGQMASCRDPRPSLRVCRLAAGWAEAEIDTIHHECK